MQKKSLNINHTHIKSLLHIIQLQNQHLTLLIRFSKIDVTLRLHYNRHHIFLLQIPQVNLKQKNSSHTILQHKKNKTLGVTFWRKSFHNGRSMAHLRSVSPKQALAPLLRTIPCPARTRRKAKMVRLLPSPSMAPFARSCLAQTSFRIL